MNEVISTKVMVKDLSEYKYNYDRPSIPAPTPSVHKPETDPDPVNHPSHYTMGRIEVIEAIEDWQLPYHLGNAIKYIVRAGRKDKSKELEDLKKARWYLDRYISKKEKHEQE